MNNKRNNKGQFKIGNSEASKIWDDPIELEVSIKEYFKECDNNTFNIKGVEVSEPYTVEGLALALDCTRFTLLNYEKAEGYEPFFNTIKRAKLKIQKQKVVNGMIGLSNPAITIFDLKNNHGYKDKQEVENTNIDATPIFGADSLDE